MHALAFDLNPGRRVVDDLAVLHGVPDLVRAGHTRRPSDRAIAAILVRCLPRSRPRSNAAVSSRLSLLCSATTSSRVRCTSCSSVAANDFEIVRPGTGSENVTRRTPSEVSSMTSSTSRSGSFGRTDTRMHALSSEVGTYILAVCSATILPLLEPRGEQVAQLAHLLLLEVCTVIVLSDPQASLVREAGLLHLQWTAVVAPLRGELGVPKAARRHALELAELTHRRPPPRRAATPAPGR